MSIESSSEKDSPWERVKQSWEQRVQPQLDRITPRWREEQAPKQSQLREVEVEDLATGLKNLLLDGSKEGIGWIKQLGRYTVVGARYGVNDTVSLYHQASEALLRRGKCGGVCAECAPEEPKSQGPLPSQSDRGG
ncbi:hypothetical protein D5085_13085 [Ectothiorhodospiraceae bacterium BW-2]|nr:hypothetical protein D5085_13085 [Ectothiorhodospiraceae bacterium BW-2]